MQNFFLTKSQTFTFLILVFMFKESGDRNVLFRVNWNRISTIVIFTKIQFPYERSVYLRYFVRKFKNNLYLFKISDESIGFFFYRKQILLGIYSFQFWSFCFQVISRLFVFVFYFTSWQITYESWMTNINIFKYI